MALILLFGLAVSCGSVSGTPPSPSGQPAPNVTGKLVRAPVQACPTGEACDPVNVGAMLIFTSAGKPDVSILVGADGTFAVHLDPGGYTIRAAPPPMHATLEPSQVRVPSTGSVEISLKIVPAP